MLPPNPESIQVTTTLAQRGLRLSECLSLRIKDIDFDRGIIVVRSGKGDRDRQTALPQGIVDE
jgi:integrase